MNIVYEYDIIVDCEVEREEGTSIITIQDNEKCLTFYSVDDSISISNEMSIEEWYNEILNCISNMSKKQRLCGICNRSCKYSTSLQKEFDKKGDISAIQTNEDGKETVQAIVCYGCGRTICEKCAVYMQSDPIQDASDQTVYCLHCRNWNKRDLDLSMSYYQSNPSCDHDDWCKAGNRMNASEYWYNKKTNEVSWKEPDLNESYASTSIAMNANPKNVHWLTYKSPDDKLYNYNINTNQVQWKQTIETKQETHVCIHCGTQPKNWQVVCPKCGNRWSI